MINPGETPIEGAREDLAAVNLDAFLAAVRDRAIELDQVPLRHRSATPTGALVGAPAADQAGRFGWDLSFSDGRGVQLLMPGVPLQQVRDHVSAATPCLLVDNCAWWWNDAVSMVAAEGMTSKQ